MWWPGEKPAHCASFSSPPATRPWSSTSLAILPAPSASWATKSCVVIEERSGQELSLEFITARLREFAPDLVFLTNHIRPEYGRILPAGLPVVTWIQDETPPLADPGAGRAPSGRST